MLCILPQSKDVRSPKAFPATRQSRHNVAVCTRRQARLERRAPGIVLIVDGQIADAATAERDALRGVGAPVVHSARADGVAEADQTSDGEPAVLAEPELDSSVHLYEPVAGWQLTSHWNHQYHCRYPPLQVTVSSDPVFRA